MREFTWVFGNCMFANSCLILELTSAVEQMKRQAGISQLKNVWGLTWSYSMGHGVPNLLFATGMRVNTHGALVHTHTVLARPPFLTCGLDSITETQDWRQFPLLGKVRTPGQTCRCKSSWMVNGNWHIGNWKKKVSLWIRTELRPRYKIKKCSWWAICNYFNICDAFFID